MPLTNTAPPVFIQLVANLAAALERTHLILTGMFTPTIV